MQLTDLQQGRPDYHSYDFRDQLKRHIYARSEAAFSAGDAARDAIRTRAGLRQRQTMVRRKFIAAIGGLPPGDSPLNARTTGTVRGDGFRIEKVIFESRPRVFVTANLYLPDDVSEPRGAVLFLCGHYELAKAHPEYQSVCQHLVRAGLVVLAQDPVGQGERLSYYEPALRGTTVGWGTREHQYVGAQCEPCGDSLARYFVHDAMRGVDYLSSRPEVDPARIGVTGNSGGGTQTALMMICDPRIAAAAPATYIMNRRSCLYSGGVADDEQVWAGCSAWGFDHEDILLAMCPKPVCVLAVTYDFFPIEGTRSTVQRCKRFWKMHGHPNRLRLVEDVSKHLYTPNLAKAAAAFFSEHLLGRKAAAHPKNPAPFDPSRLWCTLSGQVRGELPGARFVFEENRDRVLALDRRRRKKSPGEAVQWLRRQVFRDRHPCDLNPRHYYRERWDDHDVEMAFWWAQTGVFNHGYLFRRIESQGRALPVTLAVWDDGIRSLQSHHEWIRRTCAEGRAVLVFEASGVGSIAPYPHNQYPPQEFYGVIQKFHHDLLWLGDSIAALRTYDVLRALDMIAIWPGLDARDIHVCAEGKHGLYGQLAAALDRRIRKLTVAGGIGSYARLCRSRHYDDHDILSVILPGALRYLDLPNLRHQTTDEHG